MTRDNDNEDFDNRSAGPSGTSGKAVFSFVLGLMSPLCTILTAIPGIILGIVALIEISNSRGRRTGKGLAIAGLALSGMGMVFSPFLLAILIGLLLPAVQKTREAAASVQSQNNLKQIALGMHEFEANYNHLPPAVVYDKNGRPMYSWRVLLLPYVGENALYSQFHLDEPWDSPNNLPLLSRMPPVYRNPNDPDPASNSTYYQVFNGPGAIFNSDPKRGLRPFFVGPNQEMRMGQADGTRLATIPDGTSNTFLVVEAGQAVQWTKPDDVAFDPARPLPKLGLPLTNRFHVAFADGSTRRILPSNPEAVLKLYIQKDDGNVLPPLN